MPTTPDALSPAAVLAWSGPQEMNKGRSYVADLDELTAQPGPAGLTLTGTAYGQEAYQVQATLRGGQVVRGQCSCPVGGGGHCKHTAALLTRYSAAPQDFGALLSLVDALKDQTAAKLRKLVGELLLAAPELTAMVCTPPGAAASDDADQPPQVAALPAMFRAIKNNYHSDWQYDEEGLDTSGPDSVLNEADELWDDRPEQALAICLALIDQIEAAHETWADADDGPFADLMSGAVSGLATLVAEDRLNEQGRTRAVSTLLGLENLADLAGNEDFGDYAEALRPPERAELRTLLQQWHDNARDHRRAPFARALLQLVPRAEQTPETRETLLLSSHDPYEAAEFYLSDDPRPGAHERLKGYLVQTKSHISLEPLLEPFEATGTGGLLEEILTARIRNTGRPGHLTPELKWLFRRYVASGRQSEALELAKAGLLAAPSVAWEESLRQVSSDWVGDWNSVYRVLRVQSAGQNAVLQLLLDGHHEPGEAEAYDREHGVHLAPQLRHALAKRLGHDPASRDRAVQIVLELANTHIQRRGRKHYQAAAEQLTTLTDLLGPEAARERVAGLAEANRHLPSLRDELRRAGML